jgi:predicted ester cyclase/mannose-6-phosphate isomerase-like protein (cupin superfamily)
MRTVTMSRTLIVLIVLALALSLTTGTALARLVFTRPSVAPSSPSSGPEVTIVRAFYTAINDALQTGDVLALERLVADDVVEHPDRLGTSPGRAGLVETLAALRVTFPGLQLVVEDVRSAGDQIAARVQIKGVTGRFLGLALSSAHVPWGPIDLFRVDGGAIVEHWGVPPDAALFLPLTQAPIQIDHDPRRSIALERRDYAPNASWSEEVAFGPVLIMGQTGSLTITINDPGTTPALLVHIARPGGNQTGEPIGDEVAATVVPGELLMLPEGTRFTTSNWNPTTESILVLTLRVPAIPAGAPAQATTAPDGVTRSPQAMGPAAAIPPDALVQIGQMTLNPGAELPSHITAGPEFLIVESGSLALMTGEEMAWVRRGDRPESSGERLSTLQTGDGAMVPPDAIATYRNTGEIPVTVFVLTILAAA